MKKEKLDAIMESLEGTSIKTCEISSKGNYLYFSRSLAPSVPAPAAAKLPPAAASDAPAEGSVPGKNLTEINSNWVGYFFRGKEKNGKPLVKLRDVVKEKGQVGIVITMNVVHAVMAPVEGKIEEILVEDGQAVEYGQPLMRMGQE